MRSVASWFAASVIGLAGIGVSFADNTDPPIPSNGARMLDDKPSTTQPSMVSEKEQRAVQHGLANITDKLLTKDGFDSLNKWVIYEDVGTSITPAVTPKTNDMPAGNNKKFQSTDDLNAAVDLLRTDWNEKYKDSFTLNDSDRRMAVFNDSFRIYYGDIGNLARTASERILPGDQQPADTNKPSDNADQAMGWHDVTVCINCDSNGVADKDTTSAILHLRREKELIGSDWKLVLPTNTQPDVIRTALWTQLRQLHDDRANWPADENTAYRVVTQHVLSALAATASQMPMPMPGDMPK